MPISTSNAIPFFQNSKDIVQPYALMDLDDTLFQTQRKIDAWGLLANQPTRSNNQLVCASINKQGEPLSFMTGRQQALFNWLLTSTDLIVVTARDTAEIKRVKLPFSSWQVLTHGAVIMQPDGLPLRAWQTKIAAALQPLQTKLRALTDLIAAYNTEQGNLLKLTMHSDDFELITEPSRESDSMTSDSFKSDSTKLDSINKATTIADSSKLTIYLAVKHVQKDHQALQDLATWLSGQQLKIADDFYVHCNANNLAILPHSIHKKHAVTYLLDYHLDPSRPSFGFGDSLADLPFLQLLDWYGTPNHGQLHDKITSHL